MAQHWTRPSVGTVVIPYSLPKNWHPKVDCAVMAAGETVMAVSAVTLALQTLLVVAVVATASGSLLMVLCSAGHTAAAVAAAKSAAAVV